VNRRLKLVWAGLLQGVVFLAAVAWFVGPINPAMGDVFVLTMLGVSLTAAALAHVMAKRLGTPDPAKSIVAFAIADAGALAGGVAWLLTGDVRSLCGLVAGVLSLALLFPREKKPEGDETVRLMPPP